MISNSKLIDFYNRAVSEHSHPDPEKAIFGRAQLSGLSASFEKGGRIGLFSISKKKAEALGWDDLNNPEQNFRAAMHLDSEGYTDGEFDDMYIASSGISGGQKKKDQFIIELDTAFSEIQDRISWEGGQPISLSSEVDTDSEIENRLDGASTQEQLMEATKRESAQMQRTVVDNALSSENIDRDIEEAMNLLKEYISRSVQ